MKKFSKWLALLAALTMMLCMTSCGMLSPIDEDTSYENLFDAPDKDAVGFADEDNIVGEWVYPVDLSEQIAQEMEAQSDIPLAPDCAMYLNVIFTFTETEIDIACEVEENSFSEYMDQMAGNLIDYMYDMAEEQGMSHEDFEAAIEDEYGQSLEDYVNSTMEAEMDATLSGLEMDIVSGYYELDAGLGRIYMAQTESSLAATEEYMEYSLSGGELTIKSVVDANGEVEDPFDMDQFGVYLPWTFTKR